MAITIAGRAIRRVAVVEDDQSTRESYGETVQELPAEPYLEPGPIADVATFVKKVTARSEAVVCDYRLQQRNYARSNGDGIVVSCYNKQFPAILCTAFSDVDVTLLRRHRRFIPVLMSPRDVNPDTVARGIERCIREYGGEFAPTREPERTLVRVDELVQDESPENSYLYVVLPGWEPVERIRLYYADVPDPILDAVKKGATRLHTEANVGAERPEDLYLDYSKWEPE